MATARAVDGTRIHYESIPAAPVLGRGHDPVLLVQGLGADMNGWAFQRLALAGRHRVVAFDNRGAGRSDKPIGPYDLLAMADDAIAVMDAAGIERAHVVGASMGGAIAQILTVLYPERVSSLVLACTAARNHPWREELFRQWIQVAANDGMQALGRTAMRWLVGPRSLRRFAPALGLVAPMLMSAPAHSFISQCQAILDADESLAAQLATIVAPTMVIVGNQDILTPRGDSEELAELIPHAELVVIAGAAHGLMVEHASTFNRVVLDFLGRAQHLQQQHRAA
jgi:3-oxoadipate enol-lactonase